MSRSLVSTIAVTCGIAVVAGLWWRSRTAGARSGYRPGLDDDAVADMIARYGPAVERALKVPSDS